MQGLCAKGATMTPLHIALLASVAMGALAGGIIMGLCIIGKSASDAMSRALDERVDEQIKSKAERKAVGRTRAACGCIVHTYDNGDVTYTRTTMEM
jgi:hypothetical protein